MLVSTDDYQRLTKDLATNEDDVYTALQDGQAEFQSDCNRQFEYNVYLAEPMKLIQWERLYPQGYPLISVQNPDTGIIDGSMIVIPYYQYDITIATPYWYSYLDEPWVAVDYTAGWTADQCPIDIKRAICEYAFNETHPVILPGVPIGATSASVGNVSVSGPNLSTFGVRGPQYALAVKYWRRRTNAR